MCEVGSRHVRISKGVGRACLCLVARLCFFAMERLWLTLIPTSFRAFRALGLWMALCTFCLPPTLALGAAAGDVELEAHILHAKPAVVLILIRHSINIRTRASIIRTRCAAI